MIRAKHKKTAGKTSSLIGQPSLNDICSRYIPHHILIAMPHAEHGALQQAILYIYQHNQHGASGVIINQDLSTNLGVLLEQLEIEALAAVTHHPVLFGGPVNPDNGFILYPQKTVASSHMLPVEGVLDPISVTNSRQDLRNIATGKGPETFLITLGYCSWAAGQLEKEIQNFDWLVIKYDESLLFEVPISQRRAHAATLAGFNINQLSTERGYA